MKKAKQWKWIRKNGEESEPDFPLIRDKTLRIAKGASPNPNIKYGVFGGQLPMVYTKKKKNGCRLASSRQIRLSTWAVTKGTGKVVSCKQAFPPMMIS